jgi:E2F/DP family winged-helix DNA-binding domain
MKKKDDGLENDSRDKVMIDVDERKSEENEIRPSIEGKGGNTNATDGGTSARGEVQEDSDLDGEIRARKRPRRKATGRMRQDDTANTNGVNSSCNGLALLAQRFHGMLITATSDIIDPIDAVEELGIPKRRIYDVVNILEGASVIERTTSEEVVKYRWIHIGDLGLKDLEEEERQLDEWIKQTSRLVVSSANSLELYITSQQLSPLVDESSTALAIAMPCKSIVHQPHELEKGPENGHHSFALIFPKTHDQQQSMLPKAFILESGKDNVVSMHHLSLIPPQMEDNIDVHEDTPMQAM